MSHTFLLTNGDISYDVSGQPAMTLNGTQKLSQDLGEAAQSPINDVGFGFGIADLVGQVEDPDAVPSLLDQLISDGLDRLTALQQQNQSLIRDDFESIGSIASVQAGAAAPGNKTDWNFSFAVNSVNQTKVQKKGGVSSG